MSIASRIDRAIRKRISWAILRQEAGHLQDGDCSGCLDALSRFITQNADISYRLSEAVRVDCDSEYKYVGAQLVGDGAVPIPSGASAFVTLGGASATRIAEFKRGAEGVFQWTGGCVHKGRLYCFPRASNSLLSLDPQSCEASVDDLGQGYRGEHHYGGVLCGDTVYQPPRDTGHILAIDLDGRRARRISLAPSWLHFRGRYCGSVLHPNGLVYFLPEHGRVIEFDPESEGFRFMGPVVRAMAFDVAVDVRGHLYGFSAYAEGILHVDPFEGTVEMIREDIGCPGAYGTKLGVNGHMYSAPGDGDEILEFDPATWEVEPVGSARETGLRAKCAGGAVLRDGTMAFAPARGSFAYLLAPSRRVEIPEGIYRTFFSDCY